MTIRSMNDVVMKRYNLNFEERSFVVEVEGESGGAFVVEALEIALFSFSEQGCGTEEAGQSLTGNMRIRRVLVPYRGESLDLYQMVGWKRKVYYFGTHERGEKEMWELVFSGCGVELKVICNRIQVNGQEITE